MDVLVLVVMGTIGGVISSIVFIRGLHANSTPYNVAVPLALLVLLAVFGSLALWRFARKDITS